MNGDSLVPHRTLVEIPSDRSHGGERFSDFRLTHDIQDRNKREQEGIARFMCDVLINLRRGHLLFFSSLSCCYCVDMGERLCRHNCRRL